MRILLIRHGDPDYINDCLTEKGRREASLLADLMEKETVKDFFVSPLGRARETASYTLKRLKRTAEEKDWLREFPAKLEVEDSVWLQKAYPDTRKEDGRFQTRIVWDMLPAFWKEDPAYQTPEGWRNTEVAAHSDLNQAYGRVAAGIDDLLERYGYIREGHLYRTEKGNRDTIACFCHFGVSCVILSHLWNVSPFVLWHSLAMAPTSVTELYTEERQKGTAVFRASRIGDLSHLYAGREPASFSARFCETYESRDERH